MKELSRAYVKQQKWFLEEHVPTFEEYMICARITTLVYITSTVVIPGIKSATKETIDWVFSDPKILVSLVEMGRLRDDLASYQVSIFSMFFTLNDKS